MKVLFFFVIKIWFLFLFFVFFLVFFLFNGECVCFECVCLVGVFFLAFLAFFLMGLGVGFGVVCLSVWCLGGFGII